jgi:hypothetical protein
MLHRHIIPIWHCFRPHPVKARNLVIPLQNMTYIVCRSIPHRGIFTRICRPFVDNKGPEPRTRTSPNTASNVPSA